MRGCAVGLLILTSAAFACWALPGCAAKPPGPTADQFTLHVEHVLDENDTKVMRVHVEFTGEQRIGVTEGRGDLNYVFGGSNSKDVKTSSGEFLIFAHQTQQKDEDEVIRRISFFVMPKVNGGHAGGTSVHHVRGEGTLSDEIELNLPRDGIFPLGKRIHIGEAFGQPVNIYVGPPSGWDAEMELPDSATN
ncbi:MAG: hypothetical protein KDA69_17310 [Planctomycetaceae bacterium]|nr:hypothetical protein [Planctomycetaceae bacterium]